MLDAILYIIIGILLAYLAYQKMTHMSFVSEAKIPEKVVIVTGSNTGIGYETAKELSRRAARVILACRDLEKARKAASEIQSVTGYDVIAKHLDLSSFQSILIFARDIIKHEKEVNILINNAGTGNLDNSLTQDNLPIEAQVNHFGPFLLTLLLLPVMKDLSVTSRIINVTSNVHKHGTIKNLDKQGKTFWERRRVYANTKLANILFTKKLAEQVWDNNIIVNCLHPGVVYTGLFRNKPPIIRFLLKFLFLTPEDGAQTTVYLAVAKLLENVSGMYFINCSASSPSKNAVNRKAADKLWKMSLKNCFLKRW